jgi:hypothetical protein
LWGGFAVDRPWLASLLLFGPALAWSLAALGGLAWTAADAASWATVDRHGDPVAGSDSCRSCHGEQWRSWHRSYHRTMTQRPAPAGTGPLALQAEPPEPAQVLAPFAGETLDYMGFRATMDRSAAGVPRVTVVRIGDDGEIGEVVLAAEVALTVGSHRYQQYVAYLDRGGPSGELWRLPVAWHPAEQRWIHMNGAFVEPEGEHGSLVDYERHLSRWNDNCIFCHNTEPAPGMGEVVQSEVGELGIACEACHGPAEAHLARHKNPLRRMLASGSDGSITNPAALSPARESEICGRCHGQRIARDIATVMREGDGFVPGDALDSVSRPIFADSTIPGVAGLDHGRPFTARFWPDGTSRLSAYEYQALMLSPCWDGGEGLGCGHCHDMHGDDPVGQVRTGRAGRGACIDCHPEAELRGSEREGGHGGHGDAVDCLACHMPRVTYGLLEGMITHRISSPDPAAWIGRADQPDACTQCHVDRSRTWAAESMARLGLRGSIATQPPASDEALASRVLLDLLGGDPIQRNLAADALARPDATGSLEHKLAWLAEGLEDEYPSVRWFAWRGMRTLVARLPEAEPERRAALQAALARFDYLGPIAERVEVVMAVRSYVGPAPLLDQGELRERLLGDRHALAIWIGE